MEFTERLIVLRVGSFKEADQWVRLLSPTRGIFSAFAFGGSKSRKRFSGCIDLFNEVVFHVKGNGQGEYLALQEGTLIKGPDRLRRDWRRMGIAVNCSHFMESFQINAEGAADACGIFTALLNRLEEDDEISQLLPIFFRARLAFGQGFALDPHFCSVCGKPWAGTDFAVLPINESGLMCRNCAPDYGQRFVLQPQTLSVLRHVLVNPLEAWSLSGFDELFLKECARAIDGFLQYNIGIQWDKGRFRRG